MELISHEHLDELMDNPFSKNTKLIVSGPRGFVGRHFTNKIGNPLIKDRVNNILGGFQIMNPAKENKTEDKMEISTMIIHSFPKHLQKRMVYGEQLPDELFISNKTYRRWMLRVALIAGFAYCGTMTDSVYAGFIKNQKPENRKFQVTHEDIYPILRDRMIFTGDSETDFENAFKVLWLHFPQELTGFDHHILSLTLQEGFLEHRFE